MKFFFLSILLLSYHVSCELQLSNEFVQTIELNRAVFELINSWDKFREISVIDATYLTGSGVMLPIYVETFRNLNNSHIIKRKSTVIWLESLMHFMKFAANLNHKIFDFSGYFLLIFDEVDNESAQNIFRVLFQKFIYNVAIITRAENQVTLQTFMPFNPEKCQDMRPVVINKFDRNTSRWITNEIFPEKFLNFYGCSLRLTTYEYAPAVMRRKASNGSIELYGNDVEMLNGLSNLMNFTANVTFLEEYGSWGVLFPNGSGTFAVKDLLENRTDLAFGFYFLSYPKSLFLDYSDPYFMMPVLVMIPFGLRFSAFEKLFIPFQWSVWIALLITIITGIVVILVVEYRLKFLRNFLIGSTVRSPMTEMFVHFIGNSSHILPALNFARFILMNFVMFSFVLRSLFQSGIFNFLQSDIRGRQAATVEELVQKGFTIYGIPALELFWKDMKFRD